MKRSIAIACLLAALAPHAASAEHCTDITMYSYYPVAGTGFSYDATGWVGCGQDPEQNTDYLLPGSSGVIVFTHDSGEPLAGAIDENGERVGSYLETGGEEILLTFTQGTNAQGVPTSFWYSQTVLLDQALSVTPGHTVTATLCFPEDYCFSRTYRSVVTA